MLSHFLALSLSCSLAAAALFLAFLFYLSFSFPSHVSLLQPFLISHSTHSLSSFFLRPFFFPSCIYPPSITTHLSCISLFARAKLQNNSRFSTVACIDLVMLCAHIYHRLTIVQVHGSTGLPWSRYVHACLTQITPYRSRVAPIYRGRTPSLCTARAAAGPSTKPAAARRRPVNVLFIPLQLPLPYLPLRRVPS